MYGQLFTLHFKYKHIYFTFIEFLLCARYCARLHDVFLFLKLKKNKKHSSYSLLNFINLRNT